MIERFRYLPCALHPALSVPTWAKIKNGDLYDGSPYSLAGPRFFIDLAHPAGWDHAVRALYAIRSPRRAEESSSVSATMMPAYVRLECDADEYGVLMFGSGPMDWDVTVKLRIDVSNPDSRREALCRCICAALGVDVDQVFSLEKA